MGIIPLDDECFWCIIPYIHHVEICRQGIAITYEECDWYKMTNQEKLDACNRLIQYAMKEHADVPDVSKRPQIFVEL